MTDTVKMVRLDEAARILADALVECRREALEEAAKLCVEANAYRGGHGYPPMLSPEELAAAIRALIDQKPT